jgi:hypothetical protein
MSKYLIKRVILVYMLSFFTHFANAQEPDSSKPVYHFSGNVSVTNNGFSLIPTFSLGKPATIAVLSLGGERFSLDPQFRFDLEGIKPWSFIFMWRYKLIQTDKFLVQAGLHFPAISFKEQTIEIDGETMERSIPSRFFSPQLTSTYMLSSKIGVGLYYLFGLGLEEQNQARQTHFISMRAYFTQIAIGKQLFFSWNPQVYYLNMDGAGGYYVAQSLELGHHKIPVSFSTMMNIKLKSEIETKDFDWNISLIYSFRSEFTKK